MPDVPIGDKIQAAYVYGNEWSKLQRSFAALIECSAAVIAALTLLPISGTMELWNPLLALLLTLAATSVRQFAERNHFNAQKCRWASIEVAVTENDAKQPRQLALCELIPRISRLANIVINKKNLTVWGYYGPYSQLNAKGTGRLRELIAYSAYFSWKNSQVISRVTFVLFCGFLLATLVFTYTTLIAASTDVKAIPIKSLALSKFDSLTLVKGLELVCTGVIGFVCRKLYLAWKRASESAKECQRITELMVRTTSLDTDTIKNAAQEYGFERLLGQQPSTIIYLFSLRSTESGWLEYRNAIKSVP